MNLGTPPLGRIRGRAYRLDRNVDTSRLNRRATEFKSTAVNALGAGRNPLILKGCRADRITPESQGWQNARHFLLSVKSRNRLLKTAISDKGKANSFLPFQLTSSKLKV
jgi:hypothetical protein